MATTRIIVDVQLQLTVFLVVLLWSLHIRLSKHTFFRWWAWAWTSFAGFLCIGALALRAGPGVSLRKEVLVLLTLACGFLETPLLLFGAWALKTNGAPRKLASCLP